MDWIWTNKEGKNQYVEFVADFMSSSHECRLQISADTEYVVWMNGKFAANGQYADYPFYKVYDEVDISSFIRKGQNRIAVLAWHMEGDFSVHYSKEAAVCFSITDDEGKVLLESGDSILCRVSKSYAQNTGYTITPQVGYGWRLDLTKEDEWKTAPVEGFSEAAVVKAEFALYPRPVKRCVTKGLLSARICAQGVYRENEPFNKTAAQIMQTSWLSSGTFAEMTGRSRIGADLQEDTLCFQNKDSRDADGIYVVLDLEEERTGYPHIDIEVMEECKMYFGFGEHLSDLRVRTWTGGRNFAFELRLKRGRNRIEEYTRRLGCRYLMVFVCAKSFLLHRVTLVSCEYPFQVKKKQWGDRLLQRIYEVGVNTLKLCVHDHYEDCPWREQALYAMDSRNQMLFGYGVFEEWEMPKASIKMLAYSQRSDGLLSLCAPSRSDVTIPSFSLYWVIAFCENAEKEYAEKFVLEMLPYAERIMDVFKARMTQEGIESFSGAGYWNFHEWSEGFDGGADFTGDEESEKGTFCIKAAGKRYELILTALFYIAATKMDQLEAQAGRKNMQAKYVSSAREAETAIEGFYCVQTGLYASYKKDNEKQGLHGYALSLVACTGCIPKERVVKIAKVLKNPPQGLVAQTFATLQWKYDAIMKGDGDLAFVTEEICNLFGNILMQGLKTFPETQNGEKDFEDGGSLCHAWSAVACYVMNQYMTEL